MAAQALAVLTAAGSGSRLGSDLPKALVRVQGRPLLVWALRGLADSGSIAAVCVTAPADQLPAFERAVATQPWPFAISVVPGGASRQASVYQGLLGLKPAASSPDQVVLVHDAARCFTPPELIRTLVRAVDADTPAVVPALPVTDTIKVVGEPVRPAGDRQRLGPGVGQPQSAALLPVVSTPPRAGLRKVQTPQAFTWDLLLRAHEADPDRAADESRAATDDSALVEALGQTVWLISGSPAAFKITTAADLVRAEAIALAPRSAALPNSQ